MSDQQADDKFMYTKKHDKIKDDYCLDNNITLFRISYKDNLKQKLIFLKLEN